MNCVCSVEPSSCLLFNPVVQALQFLSKAHHCLVQAGGWEKDPALFKEVLKKALDMGEGTASTQCPSQLMMMTLLYLTCFLHWSGEIINFWLRRLKWGRVYLPASSSHREETRLWQVLLV